MNWIQILGPSLLLIIGGIISWFIKSRVEELQAIEEKLREDRRKIYLQILDPYIKLFSDISQTNMAQQVKRIKSYDYKKAAFELNIFGSDNVIAAYNNLMTHIFQAEASGKQDPNEMFDLWGKLLLEIRKSLGNKKTNLNSIDMLRGMIKDIDNLKSAS
ncbi:hypothetical protein MUP95_04930 [bacterium]|nr:hypothetical protein [bacterium]